MEMKENVFTGKTVSEAIEAGLAALSATKDQVEIEVLEEGKKKLFGSIPAQVKITLKKTDGERAVQFLEGLFEVLGMQAQPELVGEDEKIVIDLKAEKARSLIGRRGEVIDAIQVLAGAVANTGREEYKRVVVDCENYREEREETLRHVAEKLAAKAIRMGKKVRLEPMNPYERRIIHSALVDNEEVTTKSEGKEPARYVVIIPKKMKTYEKKDRYSRDRRDDRRDGRGKGYSDRKFGEKKPYPKRELPKEDTPQSSGTSLHRDSSSSGYRKGSFNGFFGTFLGNSRETQAEEQTTAPETEKPESDEE